MHNSINSLSHSVSTQLLFTTFFLLFTSTCQSQELLNGFRATPNPSISKFQSLLTDPTGNFSLGFLRINQVQLALSVVHYPSLELLWKANQTVLPRWSDRTELTFNGSLVISDPISGVFWSSDTQGDKVVLLNTSNLQIIKVQSLPLVVWQSFDSPQNTLVQTQNLTSAMSLKSSNGLYSLRLGEDFMALYAKFEGQNSGQIYWKRDPLEARAVITEGKGPLLARVDPNGFLGMYQSEKAPVDIQAFRSYNLPLTRFLILRIESDGNLKGYFWNGSDWVLDYQAISDICELPNPCGSYSLCKPGSGCSCLDNRTDFSSGKCSLAVEELGSSGLCSNQTQLDNSFWVLRKEGIDLPFKELMRYKMAPSQGQCESLCESNCSCWGTVYNIGSEYCYFLDYPVQTLLGVGDESKVGYFKMSESKLEKKNDRNIGIGIGILVGSGLILIGVVGFGSYRVWRRKRVEEDGVITGPYKNLGSASFRSIEMGSR
ncbi:D-mannose binding lectin protein with Apple-like carbohydrate-binding domain [Euphorbia peplus]|nr:D-mannose binding lectin protein with Apple-like carbohydrate-binding domain [Euphorbia peplus]